MVWLACSTLIVWLLSLWCFIGVMRMRGVIRRLRRLVAALAFASLAILLTALLAIAHAFHAFSAETLVARVITRRLASPAFELTYTPADETPQRAHAVQLAGDQWAISGGIIKWHRWLTAIGLPSYHKPMRLSGQFSDLGQQRTRLPTIHALEPGSDWLWETCYRAAPYLPFVEAVYGSSASIYVEPDVVQDVYVTPSGYLIKRASRRF